ESSGEGAAGNSRGDLPGRSGDAGGRRHFGIKGLDLARTAMEKQEDDRLLGDEPFVFSRPRCHQPWQRQFTECQASNLKKCPAMVRAIALEDFQHRLSLIAVAALREPRSLIPHFGRVVYPPPDRKRMTQSPVDSLMVVHARYWDPASQTTPRR